jgi:hypothetical protein
MLKSLVSCVITLLCAYTYLIAAYAQTAPTQTVNVRLNWVDNSTNEEGFRIRQCVGQGCTSFTTLATPVAANMTTYTDVIKNDPGNRTICYQVVAFNSAGSSPPTNTACLTTPAIVLVQVPGGPTGVVATVMTVTVDLPGVPPLQAQPRKKP